MRAQNGDRLGKGLAVFFGDNDANNDNPSPSGTHHINISSLSPNPDQPRRHFEQSDLEELAQSIQTHGIIQPSLVYQDGENHYIIAGERRCRAASMLNLATVPVVIMEKPSKQNLLEMALLENIQRKDLSPIEEAKAYQTLIEDFSCTHEIIAQSLGKSRAHVSNMVRILKLPIGVIDMISTGKISTGHAKILLTVEEPEVWARQILSEGLSVRALEKRINQLIKEVSLGKENDQNSSNDASRLPQSDYFANNVNHAHQESPPINELTSDPFVNSNYQEDGQSHFMHKGTSNHDDIAKSHQSMTINQRNGLDNNVSMGADFSPDEPSGDVIHECYALLNRIRETGLDIGIVNLEKGRISLTLNCEDDRHLYALLRLIYTTTNFKE